MDMSILAISYSMTGRHQEAEATMRKAVALAPGDRLLLASLAAVLRRMGKTEEARQEMELARKLHTRIRRQ
jgi:Flp pilus assembly protein TadD